MVAEPAQRMLRGLQWLEDGLLVAAVVAMVVLAGLQIVLRGALGGGILWIEPLLRALVLWIGMLGALVASRTGQHIAIDVLTSALPAGWRRLLRAAASAFTALVCAGLAWHAGRYVALEYEFAEAAFADVPSWAVVLILPVVFGLIGLRYAAFTVAFLRGREPFGQVPS